MIETVKKVSLVITNYIVIGDEERFDAFEVGVNCSQIDYHVPQGEGDKHYCDIHRNNGEVHRAFNLNSIDFKYENVRI